MIEELDQSQATSSIMTPSLTSTLAEGADLMREQDAEILEQGIFNAESGETPVLSTPPLVREGPSGSFDLGLSQAECDQSFHESPRSFRDCNESSKISSSDSKSLQALAGESFNNGDTFISSSASSSPLRTLSNNKSVEIARSNSLSHGTGVPRAIVRRCLSGDDRAAVPQLRLEETMSSSIVVRHAQSDVTPSEPIDELLSSDEHPSARSLTWTKSKERLISEVAQFAEAVGELPPTNESDVQEIIEESSSDEDDDDDDDIDNANASTGPLLLTPRKQERRRARSLSPVSSLSGSLHKKDIPIAGTPEKQLNSRPRWPFKPYLTGKKYSYLHKLPTDRVDTCSQNYKYKGIKSNPPEVIKRGITRGNYAQLHRKAWLEVSDKYHRYGKNLRTYYKYWESLGHPTNMFFDWLDSKGEAAGLPLPNLPECPRSVLDSDTVLYITNEDVQKEYEIEVVPDELGRALMKDIDGDPVRTGSEGWIVVLRDHKLYGAEKVTSITGYGSKQRFHHSSFFGGKAVAAAGIIITEETGHLTRFYPHSGHYRPGEAHMQRMLFDLHHRGVDLCTFDVDTQQILHVTREDSTAKGEDKNNGPEKKKKIHSLHLKPAVYVACFLAHKARFMGEGVYSQIHKIRKASVATVTEALDAVDDGGYWKKLRRELVK